MAYNPSRLPDFNRLLARSKRAGTVIVAAPRVLGDTYEAEDAEEELAKKIREGTQAPAATPSDSAR